MTLAKRKTVDFNTILVCVNLMFLGASIWLYWQSGENQYVNLQTVIWGGVLALQTHLALYVEKRRREPFIVMIAFTMIFFYLFRIITLTLYPSSVVFERFQFEASDLNYAIRFILAANLFLYAGFYAVKRQGNAAIDTEGWAAKSPVRVLMLLLVMIVFSYTNGIFWTADNVPRFFNFVRRILDVNVIVTFTFVYLYLFHKSMASWIVVAICGAIIFEGTLHLLTGSRSVILAIALNVILVTLAVRGRVVFSQNFVRVTIAGLPIIAVLLVVTFATATFMRQNRDPDSQLDVINSVRLISDFSVMEFEAVDFEKILTPLFDRIGYLDYASEIIAHKDIYDELISPSTYMKSIVDNLLTPGFDVFDQPKLSNALRFVYQNDGTPEKSRVSEAYQSDQFCLYGELYGLLGYGSLPFFFLFGYGLKRVYIGLRQKNPLIFTIKRLVVLIFFQLLLNSYGFDWVVIDTVILIASIPIWVFFFAARPLTAREYARLSPRVTMT